MGKKCSQLKILLLMYKRCDLISLEVHVFVLRQKTTRVSNACVSDYNTLYAQKEMQSYDVVQDKIEMGS